jgi:4-amino-4-deoxy-L-arabinose transferase-like glycosyltransferase
MEEMSDYREAYEPTARQILKGNGPVLADGSPMIRYPPGYPFLLAGVFVVAGAFGVSEASVLALVSVAAFGLAVLLLAEIALRCWPWPRALLCPLAFATYPLALWVTRQALSEMAFLPALYACLFVFFLSLRQRGAGLQPGLASGFMAGVAFLIRPVAIGLSLLLAGLVLLGVGKKRLIPRIGLAFVIVAGSLAAVAPWQLWIHAKTGKFRLSDGLGAKGRNTGPIRDGLTFFAEGSKAYRLPIRISADLAELENVMMERAPQLGSLRDVAVLLREQWEERPAAVTELLSRKALRSWYGTDSVRHEWLIVAIQVLYAIPLLAGVRGTWKSGGVSSRGLVCASIALIAYFWGMTVLVLSIVRYMVPAIGLVFVFLPSIEWSKAPEMARLHARAWPKTHDLSNVYSSLVKPP